jgi:hypothetical protein
MKYEFVDRNQCVRRVSLEDNLRWCTQSNAEAYELSDARGIFIAHVCEHCEDQVRRGYRQDIFTDSGYKTDERIDPEDY